MEALRGLPSPVERVAVALRRTGSHDAKASPSQVEHKQLRRLTKVARDRFGDEPLLQLRALQTHQFLRASRTLISADPPTPATNNLESLGGQLVRHGRVRGWFSEQGFLGDERTAAVLFQIHWSRATGLIDTHPFAPDVNDWKIYYRFLLSAPVNSDVDPRTDARWKLQQVAQLQRHDAGYPWLLAQGILLRRANQPAKATVALLAHRKRHPEGDWSLLARNQLAASARGLGP